MCLAVSADRLSALPIIGDDFLPPKKNVRILFLYIKGLLINIFSLFQSDRANKIPGRAVRFCLILFLRDQSHDVSNQSHDISDRSRNPEARASILSRFF